jgi:hypothetical protein
VAAGFSDNVIAWHENDGTRAACRGKPTSRWGAGRRTQFVLAADVDRRHADVLSAESVLTSRHGTPPATAVIGTAPDRSTRFATSVFAADLDGDGDLDVLSGGDDDVLWHENLTIHRNAVFLPESVITANRDAADSVFATDLDGDGDLDVLVASFGDDSVSWYQNDGTPADGGWLFRFITNSADGARAVFAADVDGDGDVDVLSASRNDDDVTW